MMNDFVSAADFTTVLLALGEHWVLGADPRL
jgi:hypothetical protein